MFNIPKKVQARFSSTVKSFQDIIQQSIVRDINETDTVTIIKDVFSDCFGYDKYKDVTSEFAVKTTYCDLAIKIDGEPKLLVEVKSVGTNLKDIHINQAVNYASHSGIEWVILTNAKTWKLYKIEFKNAVVSTLITEFDFTELQLNDDNSKQLLYLLSKEAIKKASLDDFYKQHKATSKYLIGALLLSDPVLNTIKRELKRIHKDVKLDNDSLKDLLKQDVFKREIIESEEIKMERRKVKKASNKKIKKIKAKANKDTNELSKVS